MQPSEEKQFRGLSARDIPILQKQYGKNVFNVSARPHWLQMTLKIVREPMFLLLVTACSVYFILGEASEGIMMLMAITIVTAISFFQDSRSNRALDALKEYIEPKIRVIRDSSEHIVDTSELVPGDIILLDEGMKIPADIMILESNDLVVNESIITGESVPVSKNKTEEKKFLFHGSTIEGGKCMAVVITTGNNTTLGKVGKVIAEYSYPQTIFQKHINRFVKRLALFGFAGFIVILSINYWHYRDFAESLLFALTLAMSAVPEEIPVAFSSFMALGAYKMSKHGIISRQPQVIENLGGVTVVCLDKTGTITENKMELKMVYDHTTGAVISDIGAASVPISELLLFSTLASETDPFDSMEKAILSAYRTHVSQGNLDRYTMVHEYPLDGIPPMMTHIYRKALHTEYVIAAKGAPERIGRVCQLEGPTVEKIMGLTSDFAKRGYRVLGVAGATYKGSQFPQYQDEFAWTFLGLLALYDPPRTNAKNVLQQIQRSGINVKLITGDFSETAMNIAEQVGLDTHEGFVNGDEVLLMSEEELQELVKKKSVFTRMFPEAKLKAIRALKANGEIVAMTGDGVNDAPALKAADIGIAMGRKGTETARRASDLVLTDDNLEKIPLAIREGRKISANLLKGLRYIISIHIPIILVAALPVLLGWTYPNIFTPIHVIFLELIMGPTCSIFFENEPAEQNLMNLPVRIRKAGLFKSGDLMLSIIQGLSITAGVLILYYEFMESNSLEKTRSIVFTTLIISNLFLTFAVRSFTQNIYYTIRYKNNLLPLLIIVPIIFLASFQFAEPVRSLFDLVPLSWPELGLCVSAGLVTVSWFELYKWIKARMSASAARADANPASI